MVKLVCAHLLLTREKRPVTMMFGGKQPSHLTRKRPRRLAWPRTSPFHGGNAGSNPAGDANKIRHLQKFLISARTGLSTGYQMQHSTVRLSLLI
jgi:hypothetical protein